jgi:hypothetical protein
MGSRWSQIVVPTIGLLAVTTALALLALAPVVLFPESSPREALPSAPNASREVANVTAPPLRPPQRQPASAAPSQAVSAPNAPSQGGVLIAVGTRSGAAGEGPAIREPDSLLRPDGTSPGAESPAAPHEKTHGRGHDKDESKAARGKAKGHAKQKAQGLAKGHAKKPAGAPVALGHSHAAKPHHVSHSGAGKHSGRGARAHARSRH